MFDRDLPNLDFDASSLFFKFVQFVFALEFIDDTNTSLENLILTEPLGYFGL